MILRSSPPSPFGRKVKIAADILGLKDRIKVVMADPADPDDDLRLQNPLGKIPTLILDNGDSLYDSRVIVEYLDMLAGGKIIPEGFLRFETLRLQSLADGFMDANILQLYEDRWRPQEMRLQAWVDYQADKVKRSLVEIDRLVVHGPRDILIGDISVACALGHLDLRFNGDWRAHYPKLVSWLGEFNALVPAFARTRFIP